MTEKERQELRKLAKRIRGRAVALRSFAAPGHWGTYELEALGLRQAEAQVTEALKVLGGFSRSLERIASAIDQEALRD